MKKNANESVHVRLEMPVEKRRAVLQAAIDTMELMKRYETLLRIRQEKEQEYTEFRRLLSQINRMAKELRVKELPLDAEELKHVKKMKNQSVMAPVVRKVQRVLQTKEEPKKKVVEEKKPLLDRQIEDLQRKLQRL